MGQYTPKDLFYRAPKPLLGRFFHQHGALTEIDFDTIWYKRRNLPRTAPATDRASITRFGEAVAD